MIAPYVEFLVPDQRLTAPHIGLVELDEALLVRAIDDNFTALFGVTLAEVVGHPFDALLSLRDRRGARQFYEKVSQAGVHRADFLLTLRAGGREVPTRLLMWRRPSGWTLCVEEIAEGNLIAELVSTRERWVQIVRQSGEGVGVLDDSGRLSDFNAAFFQMFDFRSARGVPLTEDAIRGAVLADLLIDEPLAPLRANLPGAARGERREIEVHHRGRWLELTTRPLALPRRRFAGVCVQARDVTERRHSEQLRLQRDAAEAANKAKSLFLASMSHELRTPLNAIIGYCELLLDEANAREDTSLAGDLERIGLSARHLLDLVRNVLDLSAIEAGRVTLQLEEVEVGLLLGELEAVLGPLAEKQGDRIVLRCPDDIGSVRVDPMRLRQVLLNLVGNAVKFTQGGEVVVTARRRSSPAGELFELEVADNGVGIPSEKLSELFQEFARIEGPAARVEGAGLGLAVSQGLVRMMGGEIDVTSELGRGAVFTIRLPVGR